MGKCLEVAEELTDSEFGFFGEINEKGTLRLYGIHCSGMGSL